MAADKSTVRSPAVGSREAGFSTSAARASALGTELRVDSALDVQELWRRIFGRHRLLILLLALIGVGLGALLHGTPEARYTASVRLVLDTADPKSRTESTSIADTARAIATSPEQVRLALAAARVSGRDPAEISQSRVSLQSLGASGILELSVSDSSSDVAARIANALATRVIQTRLDVSTGRLRQLTAELGREISRLTKAIASETATDRRALLAAKRELLVSERNSLIAGSVNRPAPSILSPAVQPPTPDARRWLSFLLLGALLGVVAGVGAAGLKETFSPVIIGGDVLSRELRTPLLASLPGSPDGDISTSRAVDILARLRLAGGAAGVEHIGLLSARPGLDLVEFADRLTTVRHETAAPAPTGKLPSRVSARAKSSAPVSAGTAYRQYAANGSIRPFLLQSTTPGDTTTGLVVVCPDAVKRADLEALGHLLRVTTTPLVGLITYSERKPRFWRPVPRRSRPEHGGAPSSSAGATGDARDRDTTGGASPGAVSTAWRQVPIAGGGRGPAPLGAPDAPTPPD